VLADETLPPRIAAQLTFLAASTPARVLLLRRPGGTARTAAGDAPSTRTLLIGASTPTGGWFERFDLATPEELFDIDLAALADDRPCGGAPVAAPFYLVCTNGKHDACCAEFGRPVVDALVPHLGDRLWECSHVGGDRFAANLVCLPSGVFYGHVEPAVAAAVVRAHDGGAVDLDRWRGRSSLPFPVQSAEAFVRREFGLTREDDLRWVASRQHGDRTDATFERRDGRRVTASVRRRLEDDERQLTCRGVPVLAPVHDLIEIAVT
jgi:hypothetical protein